MAEKLHLHRPRYARNLRPSPVRRMLKEIADYPAGPGNPSPSSFNDEVLKKLELEETEKLSVGIRRGYRATEGEPALREAAATTLLPKRKIHAEPDEVLIYGGSQQVIGQVSRLSTEQRRTIDRFLPFISSLSPQKGTKIAIQAPSYLAALQAFDAFKPQYIIIPSDEGGIDPDKYEQILVKEKPNWTYLVPSFNNPNATCLSSERRQAIANASEKHGQMILEDDPYGEIAFDFDPLEAIASHTRNAIYVTTGSKTIDAGKRIAMAYVPHEHPLHELMILDSQINNLFISTLNQYVVARYISEGHYESHLPKIRNMYKQQRDAMVEAFQSDDFPDTTYPLPQGGLFMFPNFHNIQINEALVERSIHETGVSMVPGVYFYPDMRGGKTEARYCYATMHPDQIREGLPIQGQWFKKQALRTIWSVNKQIA